MVESGIGDADLEHRLKIGGHLPGRRGKSRRRAATRSGPSGAFETLRELDGRCVRTCATGNATFCVKVASGASALPVPTCLKFCTAFADKSLGAAEGLRSGCPEGREADARLSAPHRRRGDARPGTLFRPRRRSRSRHFRPWRLGGFPNLRDPKPSGKRRSAPQRDRPPHRRSTAAHERPPGSPRR